MDTDGSADEVFYINTEKDKMNVIFIYSISGLKKY
jgi:hypothetical protein